MHTKLLAVIGATVALAVASSTANAGAADPQAKRFKLPYTGTTSSTREAFSVSNTGTGDAVAGHAASGYGTTGSSTSGAAGVYGTTAGGGDGVDGVVNNAAGNGVFGNNLGGGVGVYGSSATGTGVTGIGGRGDGGFFQGTTGIYARSSSGNGAFLQGRIGAYLTGGGAPNPAVALDNGGIQVVGAGTDTATPVFRHLPQSNLCDSGYGTVLDNPYMNGNPSALLFLQPTIQTGQVQYSAMPVYNPGSGCPAGHWVVFAYSGTADVTWQQAGNYPLTVLVVDP